MDNFKALEEKIEYCNQLIKMVDGLLDDEDGNIVYRDIMITARLGLLSKRYELERDLFIRKVSSKSKEELKIKANWDTLKAQSEELIKMYRP